MAALVIFGLFRVQTVTVVGNQNFTARQIQQAVMQDGLCRNSLYLLWKFQDKERTQEALPFLSALEVTLVNPFTVELRVYEKQELGYVQAQGKNVYFDSDGLVVEMADSPHEGIPLVSGVTVSKSELYETLELGEEGQLDTVLTLTRALAREQLSPQEIRFSTSDEIIVNFGDIRALLGSNENLEAKVAALASIYPQIQGQTGNLHMQDYSLNSQTVTFRQGEEEEDILVEENTGESEGETESGTETGDGSTAESGTESGTQGTDAQSGETSQTQALGGRVYQESDGTFAIDSEGNQYYTDAAGNITYNCQQYNYTNEDGSIIMDGYGYIDPYTGAYIN